MRHAMMIVTAIVLLAQGTALADVTTGTTEAVLPDIPPPPAEDKTCEVTKLPECQQALTSCQKDQETLLNYVKDQCPSFKDMTAGDILDHAKTGTPIKKVPVKKPKTHVVVVTGRNPNPTPIVPKPTKFIRMERFTHLAGCPAGGLQFTTAVDDKVQDTKFVCDGSQGPKGDSIVGPRGLPGKDGSSARPGKDGDTRVQFGLGMRSSAIWSKGRPTGASAAPEASLELWLAPTVEFVAGVAWAPQGDRNMVISSQVRYRALGKRLGIGVGIQYQAWNLVGNQALWQSVLGMGSAQLVLLETKHVDVSAEAGLLIGIDGYDTDAQFAIGGTGQITAALKF
jgi:hypothetical protein